MKNKTPIKFLILSIFFLSFALAGCESEEEKQKKKQEEATQNFRKKTYQYGQGKQW